MRPSALRLPALLLASVAVSPAAAHGQYFDNADSGLGVFERMLTFGELALGFDEVVTDQYEPLFGVTFGEGWLYRPGWYFGSDDGGGVGHNGLGSTGVNPLSIFFTDVVQGAAFQFATDPGVSTFTALLGGQEVLSFSAPTDPDRGDGQWFGFEESVAFDELRLLVGGDREAMVLDNLQIGVAVPEPGVLLLLGSGLLGLAVAARRRGVAA